MNTRRPALDVSGLPDVVFGHKSLVWLGQVGMMAIESTMFAIMIAAYFFLRTRVTDWPPGVLPPVILWGALNTGLFLLSAIPNQWIKRVSERGELTKVLLGLVVMTVIGIGNLVLRGYEFAALNCKWDWNAYSSAVWLLLGFHTAHLFTDWIDTVVLTVLMFTDTGHEGKRFNDVFENCEYWYFIIFWQVVVFLVVDFAPRVL
ncbi:MAG: heme-copper oxidase subunit III [Terriglobales bacterium]|jgi:cytochrome c oxidase subunit III